MLLRQAVGLAASRTFCTAGKINAIKTPMMAITTSSSISVNAVLREVGIIKHLMKKRTDSADGRAWGGEACGGKSSPQWTGYVRALLTHGGIATVLPSLRCI